MLTLINPFSLLSHRVIILVFHDWIVYFIDGGVLALWKGGRPIVLRAMELIMGMLGSDEQIKGRAF